MEFKTLASYQQLNMCLMPHIQIRSQAAETILAAAVSILGKDHFSVKDFAEEYLLARKHREVDLGKYWTRKLESGRIDQCWAVHIEHMGRMGHPGEYDVALRLGPDMFSCFAIGCSLDEAVDVLNDTIEHLDDFDDLPLNQPSDDKQLRRLDENVALYLSKDAIARIDFIDYTMEDNRLFLRIHFQDHLMVTAPILGDGSSHAAWIARKKVVSELNRILGKELFIDLGFHHVVIRLDRVDKWFEVGVAPTQGDQFTVIVGTPTGSYGGDKNLSAENADFVCRKIRKAFAKALGKDESFVPSFVENGVLHVLKPFCVSFNCLTIKDVVAVDVVERNDGTYSVVIRRNRVWDVFSNVLYGTQGEAHEIKRDVEKILQAFRDTIAKKVDDRLYLNPHFYIGCSREVAQRISKVSTIQIAKDRFQVAICTDLESYSLNSHSVKVYTTEAEADAVRDEVRRKIHAFRGFAVNEG